MSDIYEVFSAESKSLADLHAAAFPAHEAWSAADIRDLLNQDANRAFALGRPIKAFILIQLLGTEAEILTIATAHVYRQKGLASALLSSVTQELGVTKWLLDVASDNAPAIALYEKLGFGRDTRRRNYYHRKNGQSVDALLMSLRLGGQG